MRHRYPVPLLPSEPEVEFGVVGVIVAVVLVLGTLLVYGVVIGALVLRVM